MLAL
ncbi:hypothetical protein D047_2924A, partial [Vibrio parahaemolyticus VPTS-2010_2]|jgi:hypothetical protein